LLRLADDPRLPELKLASVEAIMSGGSALSPAAATTLSAHFGIPVTQGYGLAETSPLTHTDRIAAPRIGSVGTVVAGTGCRIVDLDSRAVLGAGERGEVQLRGPQLMSGYLDPAQPTGIDAEGWLSTGDVGYQDADGYLFLVDRLKDVFKVDNWLVSPSEIEAVLAGHPAVRECVVVDRPHPYRGAVPYAFVVLAQPEPLDGIQDWANAQMPYYQHIQQIGVVDAIPRSPNGKVARRDIRAWAGPTNTTGDK
jgi:long-chain acyl-CoA synthetase